MEFLLWIHIIAAATWFGAAVSIQVSAQAFDSEAGAVRAAFYRSWVKTGQVLFTPAAVVVLITGILMVTGSEAYGFGSTFVSIGFLTVIVGAALGMALYGPRGRAAAEALDSGDTATASAAISRLRQGGALELALLAITIASMVWKWGA
jgi:hypothetical protein